MFISKTIDEVMSNIRGGKSMFNEMVAPMILGIWFLFSMEKLYSFVGGFMQLKFGPDGKMDLLKSRLLAKGYTQILD